MKRTSFKVLGIALLVLALILLAGCKKKEAAAKSDDPAALEPLKTLKVYATNWSYIAEDKGWFRDAFGPSGTTVELIQGVSGNEVQLFARGELHFTSRMLYPYMLFITQGAPLVAVQTSTHPVIGVTSIMVKTESPYKTLDDLRGKRIASWRASCPYMVLFELTERKDWKEGTDWHYINTREYREALIAGEAEAISWHPSDNVAALLTTGTAREIAYPAADSVYINGGGATVHFTTREFAQNNPNITRTYLELLDRTWAWVLENEDEAAAIIERITRAPAEVTKLTWSRQTGNWSSEHDLGKVIRETEVMQDWLIAHGDIPAAKKVNVPDLFAPQYF
jgi:ABC-type nitrate/sulfonate/bicarbonate transport system substrate-binding protein